MPAASRLVARSRPTRRLRTMARALRVDLAACLRLGEWAPSRGSRGSAQRSHGTGLSMGRYAEKARKGHTGERKTHRDPAHETSARRRTRVERRRQHDHGRSGSRASPGRPASASSAVRAPDSGRGWRTSSHSRTPIPAEIAGRSRPSAASWRVLDRLWPKAWVLPNIDSKTASARDMVSPSSRDWFSSSARAVTEWGEPSSTPAALAIGVCSSRPLLVAEPPTPPGRHESRPRNARPASTLRRRHSPR